ncbi:hypothetical protein EYF80_041148 [Liparis tanakae]|uniref:Uncharacterized protein n=1 Tax=Liparis tanakae TaxID=230148 RepID=A0A4Z2G6F0_9TELE|nr:hypothetical protein EYF80_041148 [Liparis tanakae]
MRDNQRSSPYHLITPEGTRPGRRVIAPPRGSDLVNQRSPAVTVIRAEVTEAFQTPVSLHKRGQKKKKELTSAPGPRPGCEVHRHTPTVCGFGSASADARLLPSLGAR